MSRVTKAIGYIPNWKFALQNVKDEEMEQILCHHSEKLKNSFGLLNTYTNCNKMGFH